MHVKVYGSVQQKDVQCKTKWSLLSSGQRNVH